MDIVGYLIYIFIVLVVIVASMILHELAHGGVAYLLGDDTAKSQGRLTLNPLKHLDPVLSIAMPLLFALSGMPIFGGAKPVPLRFDKIKGGSWGVALVALAGPLTNFILAFIAFSIFHYAGLAYTDLGSLFSWSDFWSITLMTMISVNLGFCIFNILPIPPLDGSRVLYAFAPDFIRRFMDRFERTVGMVAIILIVFFAGTILSTIVSAAASFIFVEIFPRLVL